MKLNNLKMILKIIRRRNGRASVAQVSIQENIPWQIIRVISDSANNSSHSDFESFLKNYKKYSSKIIKVFIENIFKAPLK